MRVYRGPKSKSFIGDSHELVAKVSSETLEKGVKEKAHIRFNITKEGIQREAVCTAIFEDEDLIPMANGLLARLSVQQSCLGTIKKIVENTKLDSAEKMDQIKSALSKLGR